MLSAREADLSGSTLTGPLQVPGADITGQLICRGAKLAGEDDDGYALDGSFMKVGAGVFLDEEFTAAGAIGFFGADITGQLSCRDAKLTGKDNEGRALVAGSMKVNGDVFLDEEFTAAGAIWLVGADISGQLNCRDAKLTGKDNDGNALVGAQMEVGASMFLDRVFTRSGAIRLVGADISGQLNCRDAKLTGKDNDGYALVGDSMNADGNVDLSRVFTADGAIRLVGTDISGQLNCRDAKLAGEDNDGYALVGDSMKVSRDVFLEQGFIATGAIRLRSVRVGGSVQLRLATSALPGQVALDAAGAQVTGSLVWAPATQVLGQVNLEGATVGHLIDDWGEGRPGGFWPTGGQLRLDGFTYNRFGGDQQATVRQRLKWIRSQYPSSSPGKSVHFATQPYEQLAKVYGQTGKDSDARKVAIARRADLRRYGSLTWYRKAGNWLMDKTIKFGYQTWRAALGLVFVFVAFLVMTFFAQQHHAIEPVSDLVAGVRPVPVATRCAPSYPCFYPLGYAVDVVIPVINVHQADFGGSTAGAGSPAAGQRPGWAGPR
jgi:hypothetical protein